VNCEERSGFLFAHACDRAATGTCSHCDKSICVEHTRFGSSGPLCITCMRTTTDEDPNADPQAQAARQNPDDPYFYGSRYDDSFDADDYSAFDESDSSEGAAEGDLGAS
jgi:hypothetical protein